MMQADAEERRVQFVQWERRQAIRRYLLVFLLTMLGGMIGGMISALTLSYYFD